MDPSTHSTLLERPRYRPPIGIPARGEPRTQATVASVLLHALVFFLIIAPTLFLSARLDEIQSRGAGGPGPVGGGGGGNAGTGPSPSRLRFTPERLRYLRLSTPEPTKAPAEKKPKVEEKKTPRTPVPAADEKPAATISAPAVDTSAKSPGNGVGTGRDGTSGTGPGTGGGGGSGVGPGRGSGNGPGTGGGEDTVYPPAVVALPILPLPVPGKVRPYKMVAQFDVDSLGNAQLIGFNPSRDSGYNKRIREMLLEIRFRPAVRINGRPVRALAVITAEAM